MIQPILNKVLIRPFSSEEKSTGGLIVPESFRERNNKSTVMAVGNGTKNKPMQYKPGMVVFSVKENGDEMIVDGEKCYLIESDWILAILN
jgi:chaperonin GroES